MRHLFLEDLAGLTHQQVQDHLCDEWGWDANREEVEKYTILIGYVSEGNYGCDSSAFLLLKNIESGKLFEVHGSHCSCHGFEGQFAPEETTEDYLTSEKFNFWTGGYDSGVTINQDKVKNYIRAIQ